MANVDESRHVPVVLRVKRRRDVDPADALVVSKVRKIDSSTTAHDEKEETSVFRLAGTLGGLDEKPVLGKTQQHADHRSLTKHNPLARLSVSAFHDRRREEAKAASLDHRFQFVSKLRHLDDPNPAITSDSSAISEDGSVDHADRVQIYDVIVGAPPTSDQHTDSIADQTRRCSITCNNEAMIREGVAPPPQPNTGGSDDYVYDLYYSDGASTQDVSTYDWSSLTVYEPEYVHDVVESEEEEEEDDDSNAEDNWRNDYPDEDEWKGEEEGTSGSDDDDDDISSNQMYRQRDIPLMLNYDELRHDEDEHCETENPTLRSGCYYGNASDEERD